MNNKYNVNSELAKFSTEDLLEELLHRDNNLASESVTSYTFKFWKFN